MNATPEVPLFVGIDTARKSLMIGCQDATGTQVGRVKEFTNDLPGAQELEAYLLIQLEEGGFTKVVIGTEATSFYDFHILEFLAQSEALSKYTPLFYRLNPKLVNGFKKVHTYRTKNDRKDALLIASRLRFGELPPPYQPNMPHLPLQRMTRFRAQTVRSLTAEQNRFVGLLFLKFSAYTSIKPFSNTFGATSTAFIEEFFSPDEVLNMPIEKLVEFLVQKGRNRFTDPEAVVKKVAQVARESYRLRPQLNQSVNLVLSLMYKNIQTPKTTIKQLDKAIEEEFEGFSSVLMSIPGIGPVYAAGIYAEIGDISRFPGQAQLARYAGLTWTEHQSGDFRAQETRLIKAANSYLRYYLVEATNSVKNREPEFGAFYTKKYHEVSKHQHKRALVLTARKLVRLIYALEKQKRLYQPKSTYLQAKENQN